MRFFSRHRASRVLVIIFVATVLARLLFAWIAYPQLAARNIESDPWPDSYRLYAESLVRGDGFSLHPGVPSVMRGPIYPLFGASLFLVFGLANITAVQVAHAILDALSAILIFLIGSRVFNRRVGILAALMFAVYPLSIWYSGRMSMVSLLTFLFTWTSWMVLKSHVELSPKNSIGIGILLGVTTLTIPVTALFPFFLLAAWLWTHSDRSRVIKHWLLVCAVTAAVISPWTIRNYSVSGKFVPVSVGGGYAVLFGDLFVERFDGFSPYSAEYPSENALQKLENERIRLLLAADGIETDFRYLDQDSDIARRLNKYAMRSTVDQPIRFLKKMAVQLVTFWYLGNNKSKTVAILLIQLVFLIPWLLAGLYFCFRERNKLVIPLLLLILYLDLIYATTVANARHGMPAMPLAMVIGAFGLYKIVLKARSGSLPSP